MIAFITHAVSQISWLITVNIRAKIWKLKRATTGLMPLEITRNGIASMMLKSKRSKSKKLSLS